MRTIHLVKHDDTYQGTKVKLNAVFNLDLNDIPIPTASNNAQDLQCSNGDNKQHADTLAESYISSEWLLKLF